MTTKPVEELSRQEAITEIEHRAKAAYGPAVTLTSVFYRNLSWEAELAGPGVLPGTHGVLYDDAEGEVRFDTYPGREVLSEDTLPQEVEAD